MAIVHIGIKFGFVADVMFPKAALPDAFFPSFDMTVAANPIWQLAGKPRFYGPPPTGIIAIPIGQGPDHMQVIGQNHPSVDQKGALGFGLAYGVS